MLHYTDKIDKKLKTYIKDVKGFKEILKQNNAYIAGGFLLSAITDNSFETSDIDIYVSAINFDALFESFNKIKECYVIKLSFANFRDVTSDKETLCDKISNLNTEKKIKARKEIKYIYEHCELIVASEYDESFFKKNNIKFKIAVNFKFNHNANINLKCDIMIVNANTPVLNVINNFDLILVLGTGLGGRGDYVRTF
jgi:hypothetical protein